MASDLRRVQRYGLVEEARFDRALREAVRTLVLWRGVDCPQSARIEASFVAADAPGWALAVREVERDGAGPVGQRHRIDVTPTVAAYLGAEESVRVEAVPGEGLPPEVLRRWLDSVR